MPVGIVDALIQECIHEIQSDIGCSETPALGFKLIYDGDRSIYQIVVTSPESVSNRKYVLKIPGSNPIKPEDMDRNNLTKEFQKLQRAWKKMADADHHHSMSRPIAILKSEYAILLTNCKGQNFNDLFNAQIFYWVFQPEKLGSMLGNIGTWLGYYHRQVPLVSHLKESDRSAYFEHVISTIKKSSINKLSASVMTH